MAGKPSVNQDRFFSSIWLLLSLVCVLAGFLHCRINSYSFDFKCDQKMCTLSGTGQPLVTFASVDLVGAVIHEIAKPKPDHGEKVVRTLKVSYNAPAEAGSRFKVVKSALFTPHDMGETEATAGHKAVLDFKRADAKRVDKVHLHDSKSTTTPGLVLLIAGGVSALMSLLLGQWSKHKIDYNKKAY